MNGTELANMARMAEFDRRDDVLVDQRRFGPPSTERADVELVPVLDHNGDVTGYRVIYPDGLEAEVVIA